jgi:hypothetical protein
MALERRPTQIEQAAFDVLEVLIAAEFIRAMTRASQPHDRHLISILIIDDAVSAGEVRWSSAPFRLTTAAESGAAPLLILLSR